MRSDIAPGGTFPDYELPDHTEVPRKLSDLQGDDPMILTLARGHYCPKEHQQHLELAAFYPKIAVGYTQVVTIATDEHHTLQEFRASVGAQWTFLSDPGRIVQHDLDIQEYTDPDNNPMIPHTLVLKPGLVVHSIYNGYWFWGRPSIDDLWHDLRAASSEIRPDWDLSTPGLRDAWEAGDVSKFHGWDKRAPTDGACAPWERVVMEFLVEFEIDVPEGAPQSEVAEREQAEASAAAGLVADGHLLRVWRQHLASGEPRVLGLYRADSGKQLDDLLAALPLFEWMHIAVTPLEPHPNDPAPARPQAGANADAPAMAGGTALPAPRLTLVYRLEATLAAPLDLGDTAQGRRRIVALTGGTFTGPELRGTLLPGASADWQVVLPDGTALGDIRYTLQTNDGHLLAVRSRSVRHGPAEVLARLGRGEDVDASEYTFRTSTHIETAAGELDWLNKGVFASVGGRQPGGVIYETYLVA